MGRASRAGHGELTVWPGLQRSAGPARSRAEPRVASGSAPTRSFGAHLHVAVVAATPRGHRDRRPGTVHSYDLKIGDGGLRTPRAAAGRAEREPAPGRRPDAPRCTSPSATSSTGCRASPPPPRCSPTCASPTRRAGEPTPTARTRMAYLDDIIEEDRSDPMRAPAAAVPHRRPDLRRRPRRLPAAAAQRDRPRARRLHRDAADREQRRSTVTIANFPVLRRRRVVRELAGSRPSTACTTCSRSASSSRCTCCRGARGSGDRWRPGRGVHAAARRSRRTTCRTGRPRPGRVADRRDEEWQDGRAERSSRRPSRARSSARPSRASRARSRTRRPT